MQLHPSSTSLFPLQSLSTAHWLVETGISLFHVDTDWRQLGTDANMCIFRPRTVWPTSSAGPSVITTVTPPEKWCSGNKLIGNVQNKQKCTPLSSPNCYRRWWWTFPGLVRLWRFIWNECVVWWMNCFWDKQVCLWVVIKPGAFLLHNMCNFQMH